MLASQCEHIGTGANFLQFFVLSPVSPLFLQGGQLDSLVNFGVRTEKSSCGQTFQVFNVFMHNQEVCPN